MVHVFPFRRFSSLTGRQDNHTHTPCSRYPRLRPAPLRGASPCTRPMAMGVIRFSEPMFRRCGGRGRRAEGGQAAPLLPSPAASQRRPREPRAGGERTRGRKPALCRRAVHFTLEIERGRGKTHGSTSATWPSATSCVVIALPPFSREKHQCWDKSQTPILRRCGWCEKRRF